LGGGLSSLTLIYISGGDLDKGVVEKRLAEKPLTKSTVKTLALVGFAPSSRKQAPWDNQDITIAGLNEEFVFPWFKRKEGNLVWFQLHDRNTFSRPNNHNDPHHWEWLQQKHDFPIYMQQQWNDIPSSVKFPLEEVYKEFGNYFTSTMPFIMAWGVLNGYKRLELYGFDMASGTEYLFQRANAHYWIGYLRGKGIDIYVPPTSKLMKGYAKYAYEDMSLGYRQELENHVIVQNTTIKNEMVTTNRMQGAYEAVREASNIYPELSAMIPNAREVAFAQRDKFAQMKGWVKGIELAISKFDTMIGMERMSANENEKNKELSEAEVMRGEE
jgi:hypothetical protein